MSSPNPNQAPVCLIDPVIDNIQPNGVKLPSIPQATDLPSAIAAINAMASILRTITGQQSPSLGLPQSSGGGFNVIPQKTPPKPGRYQEQKPMRVVNTVTVYSKEDPTAFITFKRIDALTFKDTKTGELWQWTR
jgi:hypothetical protein